MFAVGSVEATERRRAGAHSHSADPRHSVPDISRDLQDHWLDIAEDEGKMDGMKEGDKAFIQVSLAAWAPSQI
jgi:hypothetical protein